MVREHLHLALWLVRHLAGRYPEPEVDRLREWLPRNSVCVDIGAHAGSWTIPLSRLGPDVAVFAFEAFPYYARILRRLVKLLGAGNVEVVNKAVSDTNETLELVWQDRTGERLTGLTHILGPNEISGSTLTVEGSTLDTFFQPGERAVRFIKMDIEGAELSALQGAERLLDRDRPAIFTEINAIHCRRYEYDPSDVFGFLEAKRYLGYVTRSDGRIVRVGPEEYAARACQDAWFLPEEETTSFIRTA